MPDRKRPTNRPVPYILVRGAVFRDAVGTPIRLICLSPSLHLPLSLNLPFRSSYLSHDLLIEFHFSCMQYHRWLGK